MPDPDLPLPGLRMAQIVADAVRAAGHRRVGILGTRAVMDSTLYPDGLGSCGVEAGSPDPRDAEAIDRIVFGELVNGVVTEASRERFVAVVERFARNGCAAVALVSTAIPMLLTPELSPLPVVDPARLAARG